MLVTELHRLLAFDPLARVPGRAIQFRCHPQGGHENKNGAVDRQLRKCVGTVMKNLGHRRSFANSSQQTYQSRNRNGQRVDLSAPFADSHVADAVGKPGRLKLILTSDDVL